MICVLGAGRGSAELVDFLNESHELNEGATEIVVLDDKYPGPPREIAAAPVVGVLTAAHALAARGCSFLSGIASSRAMGVRMEIVARMALPAEAWLAFVHHDARVSRRAQVGRGAIVYPGACIAVDAQVHDHALVYYNAVVHHDVVVERGAILCSGVLLAGHARVGEGAYLGIGATVREGVTIGARALVGMGAVVTRDVAPGAVVKGVPAR